MWGGIDSTGPGDLDRTPAAGRRVQRWILLVVLLAAACGSGSAAAQVGEAPGTHPLWVTNWASGDVSVFQINADGIAAGPALVNVPAGAQNPLAAAYSARRRRLYVSDWGSGDVSSFAVSRDGDLKPWGRWIPASPKPTNSAGIALSPASTELFLANFNGGATGSLSSFAIGRSGGLRPLGATMATGGRGSAGVAIEPGGALGGLRSSVSSGAAGPRGLAIAPDGTHAYVAHYNGGTGEGSVSVLRISPEGQLSPQGEPVATGSSGAEAIALDAAGHRLYVANFNTDGPGSITTFAVDAHGGLERLGRPVLTGGRQPDFGGLVIG